MEIFLLRHGIAEDGKPGGKDADRALTAEGKRKLREVLQVARDAGCAPQLILSSPYKRAVETARIAAEVFGYKDAILESAAFTPMSDPAVAWEEIRLHKDASSVLVASHEPLTGLLTGHLCRSPNLAVDVKKGSITRVDMVSTGAQPSGILKWILTPRLASARG
jgi:phosphohistidine phosphatase